jgi:release factor glutamine methyltransferase
MWTWASTGGGEAATVDADGRHVDASVHGPPAAVGDALVAVLRAAGCVEAEEEAVVLREAAAGDAGRLADLLARRTGGEPLEHVVGWAPFAGLRLAIGAGAYVPRRWTEDLAIAAADELRRVGPRPASDPPVAVDLCTGIGAIACAVAAAVPAARVLAADVDPVAVAWARRNGGPFGVDVRQGDLDAALPAAVAGRVDVLTAVPPYVPDGALGELHADSRRHEPRTAHVGGADGLDVVRRLGAAAMWWLRPGGLVLVEVGSRQGEAARRVLDGAGLVGTVVVEDDEGDDLWVAGRRSAPARR